MERILEPEYRYKLKSAIIAKGYRSISEFAESIESNNTRLSRVINGWEVPTRDMQIRMAEALEINQKSLAELLTQGGCENVR